MNKLKIKIYRSLYKLLQGEKKKTEYTVRRVLDKDKGGTTMRTDPRKMIFDNYFELTYNESKRIWPL